MVVAHLAFLSETHCGRAPSSGGGFEPKKDD